MKEFKDKVAVVTGAGSGIGLAMAERFAAAGMKLVLADMDTNALDQALNSLKEKTEILAVITDVSNNESVAELAEQTKQTFGAVHILCNNAGVSGDILTSWRQPLKNWEWVFGVNLWGVIYGINNFVPMMLEQNEPAHIVNTASMAGLVSLPFGAPYHASKHAVVTISESLHFELSLMNAPVKVSVLCPGWVQTQIANSARNRPEELKEPEVPRTEMEMRWIGAVKSFVEQGISAESVAEQVFQAIEKEQFYILTHPEMMISLKDRMESLLEGSNPILRMPK